MRLRIETSFDPKSAGPHLVELMQQYVRDIQGETARLPAAVESALPREIAKRENLRVYLAYMDETPVGFCIGIDSFSSFACRPVLNIHDIFTSPRFRGQGVGAALLSAMEAAARKEGYCKLTLEVLELNRPALGLYGKLGYAPHLQDPSLGRALFYEKKIN